MFLDGPSTIKKLTEIDSDPTIGGEMLAIGKEKQPIIKPKLYCSPIANSPP